MPSSIQPPSPNMDTVRRDDTIYKSLGDKNAFPDLSTKQRIENAIKDLSPGEELFVDAKGRIHGGKSLFAKDRVKPLVSFQATANGYIVTAGLPPKNRTYVSSTEEGFQRQNPLEYTTTLSSGDFIRLSEECLFQIPNSTEELPDPKKQRGRLAGTRGLEAHLAHADQGDVIVLGRALVDELPLDVSRQHLTATVVNKDLRDDGTFSMTLSVALGVPAEKPVSIVNGENLTPVVGKRFIVGKTIEAGGMLIRVPYPKNSIEEQSFHSISFFSDEALQNSVVDLISRDPNARYSLLAAQIDKGIDLIKDQKYQEAKALFMQEDLLESLGYRFEEARAFITSSLEKEHLEEILRSVAQNSWLRAEDKVIVLALGLLESELVPQTQEQEAHVRDLQKGLSLILAEEYIHVLQDIRGGEVSSLRNMVRALPSNHEFDCASEADVAVYLAERGVELPKSFIERYDVRSEALSLLNGEQTEDQKERLKSAIQATPFGQNLPIGRDLITGGHTNSDAGRGPALLGDVECFLKRHVDGTFTLEPFKDPTAQPNVFVKDDRGIFVSLTEPLRVEPGTVFYLGGRYKFTL